MDDKRDRFGAEFDEANANYKTVYQSGETVQRDAQLQLNVRHHLRPRTRIRLQTEGNLVSHLFDQKILVKSRPISVKNREMEFIERASYNTFYPFQNKHQTHQHLQSVKMLCAFNKSRYSESHEMG